MKKILGVALVLAVVGKAAVAEERALAKGEVPREFTLGLVQKELRPGLSQADVAERLGAPNIVTKDAEGREAWVYDRVSSEVSSSSGSVGVGGLGTGVGGALFGMLGVKANKSSDKVRSSQRALTVVVRFSAAATVTTFTWHDSRF